jgi:hypothetical protein
MHSSLRPLAAGSVAIVGAGLIAITPVPPTPADLQRFESAVRLTATTDWADVFSDAQAGVNDLIDSWTSGVTAPIAQQIVANQLNYLRELPDLPRILGQMYAHVQAVLDAPLAADPDTLDTAHQVIYALLPVAREYLSFLVKISDTAMQLLAFATSPLSGVLLGLAGPGLGAALVLGQNLNSIGAELTSATPDLGNAISTLLDTPAGMTDAFLNGGATLDITELVTRFGPAIGVEFPDGVKIAITLGGLLSPGGSIFNALGFDFGVDLLGIPDLLTIHLAPGAAVGPIGSAKLLERAIAKALGWDGTSNPLSSLAAPRTAKATTMPAAEVPGSVAAALARTSAGPAADASREPADAQGAGAPAASALDMTTDTAGAETPPPESIPATLPETPGQADPDSDATGGQQADSTDSAADPGSEPSDPDAAPASAPDSTSVPASGVGSPGEGVKSGSPDRAKQGKHRRSNREHAGSSSDAKAASGATSSSDSEPSSDAKDSGSSDTKSE